MAQFGPETTVQKLQLCVRPHMGNPRCVLELSRPGLLGAVRCSAGLLQQGALRGSPVIWLNMFCIHVLGFDMGYTVAEYCASRPSYWI